MKVLLVALQIPFPFSHMMQIEAQRLDHFHEILKIDLAVLPDFPNGLVIAPLPANRTQKVLDCGYGSAAWAADVAREYPRWNVCATGNHRRRADPKATGGRCRYLAFHDTRTQLAQSRASGRHIAHAPLH